MSLSVRLRATAGALALDVQLPCVQRTVAVVGPNGAGKTSLLRLLAGAQRADAGRVVLGGRTLFDSEAGIDLAPESRRVGYVPQGLRLFPHLGVLDNVAFGLSTGARRMSRTQRRACALSLLRELGGAHLAERPVAGLSGGEAQRVAVARALLTSPELLLLDEPLSAMDTAARRELRRLLASRLQQLGRPALIVTHDLRDVIALDATLCVIEGGAVTQQGSLADLRAKPASDFIAEFVGVDIPPLGPSP